MRYIQDTKDYFRKPWPAQLTPRVRNAILLIGLFIALYLVGIFLPEGFDWKISFGPGTYPKFWMPWTKPIVDLLNLPAVFALTVIAFGVRAYRYHATPLALALGLLSLPTLWVFFLGNLDGLVLLGLVLLPWGVPLVLIKPQLAAFALLARWKWMIAGGIWLLISLVIWGFWPATFTEIFAPDWKQEWVQDIALFPWGLIVALPLLWFSRGDEDLCMAAGSFATPHLFPYHFIVLMPALARMKMPWIVATFVVSWLPLLSNWLGPWAWHFGNLMGVCFWIGIYTNRQRSASQVILEHT